MIELDADGMDFVPLSEGFMKRDYLRIHVIRSDTRADLESGRSYFPKTPYLFWKIIDGVKVYCDSTPCSLHDEHPSETNGDRVRRMSNEELAREMLFFVPSDFNRHYTGIAGGYYTTAQDAIEANFDWLQRPVDNERKMYER